ncbi:MFS transporter [Cesiribacter sp. SM1]|uniref:MFS transporter n=1 Tax=Cesiribacter sp. SM1 TaxID=2861196 RepID=UPI001CD561EA|nr:MFS transporter [Cesiribacter sp. SM1]
MNNSIYTLQFGLLCLSTFLFFSSFNMIIPELPAFLENLGGGEYKGFIIGLFTVTAGLSRPFSGKLTDTIGRIPVMVFGAVVCVLCGFLYPLVLTVAGFLALRLLHGFSTGFTPTGSSAYISDVVPLNKRGEAMGFVGLCSSLGMACGPFIGSSLARVAPLEWVFWSSSAAALLSIVILAGMKETLAEKQSFRLSLLKLNRHEILEPRVMPPSVVLLLTTYSLGTVLTLVPDLSDSLGIANRGLYFLCFTLASVSVRFFAGRFSDTIGRAPVLKAGALLYVAAMCLTGFAWRPEVFLFGGIIFGFAAGINSPTAFAWAIDLSQEGQRGRGLATLYISLEVGIGLGALLSGWVYANKVENISTAFATGAILAAAAWVYLHWLQRRHRVQSVQ